MQCPFCKREVAKGATECPYCHYQFTVDAEVLSSDERDSFAGVTVEEDGSTSGTPKGSYDERAYDEERSSRYDQRDEAGFHMPGGFHFSTISTTGCLIWLLIFVFMMIFFFVAAIKLFVAFPLLGILGLVWWLNGTYHWF